MESKESGSGRMNQETLPSNIGDSIIKHDIQPGNPAVIPGIPDDIALSCLARVPRKYHPILNCVSRRWRKLVCSEEWFSYRLKHNLDGTWIYALCRDKSEQLCIYVLDPGQLKKGWKQINGIPDCFLKRKGVGFEVLGKKIYLFGGCGWIEDATDDVYCYDASANTWARAASLSTARCFFAHEALDNKIYAIGGLGLKSSDPQSWDVYDNSTDTWTSHADPNIILDIEDSVLLDKKIYIRCATSSIDSHVYAVVYDPLSGIWRHADADMASGWRGPAVVIDGSLYVLDQTSGLRLMTWREDVREWTAVGRISTHLVGPPCRLAAIGRKIFVVGRGLGTVMFDVGIVGSCVDGVLVSCSVVKLGCDDDVISCKCLAL